MVFPKCICPLNFWGYQFLLLILLSTQLQKNMSFKLYLDKDRTKILAYLDRPKSVMVGCSLYILTPQGIIMGVNVKDDDDLESLLVRILLFGHRNISTPGGRAEGRDTTVGSVIARETLEELGPTFESDSQILKLLREKALFLKKTISKGDVYIFLLEMPDLNGYEIQLTYESYIVKNHKNLTKDERENCMLTCIPLDSEIEEKDGNLWVKDFRGNSWKLRGGLDSTLKYLKEHAAEAFPSLG